MSCILVVASAAGMQVLLEGRRGDIRRRVQILCCLFAAISVVLFIAVLGQRVFGMPTFGFMLLLVFLYVPVLGWLRPASGCPATNGRRGSAAAFLLFLVFLDSSTFLYIHLREVRLLPYNHEVLDRPLPGGIGFESSPEEQANNVMSYRPLYEMLAKGLNPGQVPPAVVSLKAHSCGDVASEKALLELSKSSQQPASIALDEAFVKLPEFAPFLSEAAAKEDTASLQCNVTPERKGYNAVTIKARCSQPCLLFLRSAYSPYWSAEIDSRPIPIARAWFNFQAIPLPQGACEVHLRFSPPWIRTALVLAYLVLFGVGGLCWYYRPRRAGTNLPHLATNSHAS